MALVARAKGVLGRFDFAPDLAHDIGTPRWYRGLAVMLGGIGFAISLWPGLPAIRMGDPQMMDATAQEQWHSQTVQPLLYGGDTGQRMGPTSRLVLGAGARKAQPGSDPDLGRTG
jgi:hypothetical protein